MSSTYCLMSWICQDNLAKLGSDYRSLIPISNNGRRILLLDLGQYQLTSNMNGLWSHSSTLWTACRLPQLKSNIWFWGSQFGNITTSPDYSLLQTCGAFVFSMLSIALATCFTLYISRIYTCYPVVFDVPLCSLNMFEIEMKIISEMSPLVWWIPISNHVRKRNKQKNSYSLSKQICWPTLSRNCQYMVVQGLPNWKSFSVLLIFVPSQFLKSLIVEEEPDQTRTVYLNFSSFESPNFYSL